MPEGRRLRGEERDALVRAELVPMGRGERPPIVTFCAALCVFVALANLVLWAAGWEVEGQKVNAAGALAPALLFTIVGVGLWRTRLLAVAAMQVLLGLTAMFGTGALLVSSNLPAALLSLAIIVLCGGLFWPLIRVNARVGLRDRLDRVDAHG